MKRYICLIISLCLILGSFSFVFATATSWDTSDQANLSNAASRLYYNGYSAAYYLKQIADRVAVLSTISSDISTIKSYLFDDGHSIGYWTSAIASWMSPIYTSINTLPTLDTDLQTIINSLNSVSSSGGTTTYSSYFYDHQKSVAEYLYEDYYLNHNMTNYYRISLNSNGTFSVQQASNTIPYIIINGIHDIKSLLAYNYQYEYEHRDKYFNSQQTALNWGNLGNSYFTPSSSIDGTYKWLAAIQAPVARLSYVLASDERIAAQQAAAPAEQEVVNDFIDPTGNSSATASDFGSISNLSSGYQQNFGSTASVTGLFDIFDSNNFGWFSSETYNQLDTTVAQRGSSFETPLLDQQLEDISRALGVDYAN